MAGVYVHYLVERDEKGAFSFDDAGKPKANSKYTGRLRGGDITKYAEGDDGQPWLVTNALEAWRKHYDIEDKTTHPAIVSAYKKFITAGSVLTPRYAPMLRDGQLVENKRIAIEQRYNRGGRWSVKADDRRNADIRAWNEDILANTKVRGKLAVVGDRLRLGLLDEIVFNRTIHVHDVGLKRTHFKTRWANYEWTDGEEPMRCNSLIDTIAVGNSKIDDDDGVKVVNWSMPAPRMPEWLNKGDEESVKDDETGIEVSYSTLCYDGVSGSRPGRAIS